MALMRSPLKWNVSFRESALILNGDWVSIGDCAGHGGSRAELLARCSER